LIFPPWDTVVKKNEQCECFKNNQYLQSISYSVPLYSIQVLVHHMILDILYILRHLFAPKVTVKLCIIDFSSVRYRCQKKWTMWMLAPLTAIYTNVPILDFASLNLCCSCGLYAVFITWYSWKITSKILISGLVTYSFINMLFISTGILDEKLRPQIWSVSTTANSPLNWLQGLNIRKHTQYSDLVYISACHA
jgi:hypothetical protein